MVVTFDNQCKLEDGMIKFRAYGDRWIVWCVVTMDSIRDCFELKGSETEVVLTFAETRSRFQKLAKSIIEDGDYENGVVLIGKSQLTRL